MERAHDERQRELVPRLKKVRGDVSLREMERRSALNSGYLSQLEQGKIAHPSPAVLQKVAAAYGVRYDDVLGWAGYGGSDEPITPNQSVALKAVTTLGEPTKEELETLTAIVNLLKQKRGES